MGSWTIRASRIRNISQISIYNWDEQGVDGLGQSLEKLNARIEDEVKIEYKTLRFRFLQASGHSGMDPGPSETLNGGLAQMVVQSSWSYRFTQITSIGAHMQFEDIYPDAAQHASPIHTISDGWA